MTKKERRTRILSAAANVFSEKGFHKSSVSDIIKESNIARGTFYLYFDSKKDVFQYILDEIIKDIQMRIPRLDEQFQKGLSILIQNLKKNIKNVLDYFLQNREMTRILLLYGYGLDNETDNMLNRFYERMRQLIESSLRLGQSWNFIRPVDVRYVSYSLLGIIKEALVVILNEELQEEEIIQMVSEMVDFTIRGLSN